MKFVFDASALLNIIRFLGPDAFEYLKENYILTLTLYEVGNALWKEAMLLNRISVSEALSLLDMVARTCRVLNTIAPRNASLALKLACELKLTYYDSSYVITAYELNAELVTDDDKLRRRISKGRDLLVKVLGGEVVLRSTRELIGMKKAGAKG